MTTVPVQIVPNGPRDYTVTFDGIDLSRHIEALSLSIDAGDGLLPRLSLRMSRAIRITAEAPAEVKIPDELTALLLKLGWTPPATEPANTEGK